MCVMWILSVLATVGTGWLAFATRVGGSMVHAAFLLSVGAFVACSVWGLARGLAVSPQRSELHRREPRNGQERA
jgi:hypothetical protein